MSRKRSSNMQFKSFCYLAIEAHEWHAICDNPAKVATRFIVVRLTNLIHTYIHTFTNTNIPSYIHSHRLMTSLASWLPTLIDVQIKETWRVTGCWQKCSNETLPSGMCKDISLGISFNHWRWKQQNAGVHCSPKGTQHLKTICYGSDKTCESVRFICQAWAVHFTWFLG